MTLYFGSWLGCISSFFSMTSGGGDEFFDQYFLLFVQAAHGSGQGLIKIIGDVCFC